ncbi:MAG: lysophospholipid acyltransferase family protein [Proteobacteria bacterium]|nr:lysophospholipid acyltransferase family protein [Pseudomonadota bacterium]
MKRTVFDTPIIKTLLRWTSILLLKFSGWKVAGKAPELKKYVMIAAPHTSNWDFYYTMLISFALRINIYWMGKDSLFRWPLGYFFRWMGGIPINRSKSNNVVAQSVAAFDRSESLIVVVPPEGTRSKARYWKTGFYHIAHGAGVPIALGFLDFRLKMGGIGPALMPTGDIDEDMKLIKSFYCNVSGKRPDLTSDVALITDDFMYIDYSRIIRDKNSILYTSGDSDADRLMLQSYYVEMTGQVQASTEQ